MDERIKTVLDHYNIEGLLVSGEANMRYLSGFSGGTGYLLFTPRGQYVLTDSRYTVQAEEEAEGFQVIDVAGGYAARLESLLKGTVSRLGFEGEKVLYASYAGLKESLPGQELVPIRGELDALRMVKEGWELERIARAEEIGDRAFDEILGLLRPGMTELEVAAHLEFSMKKQGAEGLSFDTIAASGPNSAKPHAVPTERKLEAGDFLTMDFGCRWNGYCSDMTRTVVIGKASKQQREIYETVRQAQLTGLEAVCAGKTGEEIDRAARAVIEGAGYGDCFGHGLGHGVGLEIHEEPRLSRAGQTVLRPDMTVTVEPGIYLKGFGGVRIEDLVAVTPEGCRNLTHSPKQLIEI